MSIEVYISTTEPDKCSQLIRLFRSDLFKVETITIPHPPGIVRSNFDLEAYIIIKILKKSDPNKICFIVKDNSLTTASKNTINRLSRFILEQKYWDLVYWGYWLDRCDLYGRNGFIPEAIPETNSYLVKTSSPNGLQAVMFSPEGKKVILGQRKMKNGCNFVINSSLSNSLRFNIEKQHLSALCITPRVFEFNPLLAESVSDLAKSCACRRPEKSKKYNKNNSGLFSELHPLFWFLAIVFLVALILWCLYYLGRRPSHDSDGCS